MKKIYLSLITLMLLNGLMAQMSNGLFGNEWIDFDQSYYKIMVSEDGIYRIPSQTLSDQGISVNSIDSDDFKLFYLGEEIPIYISSNGNLGTNDYIEFYGQKNRSALDANLFVNPEEEMLNPTYSMFSDTSAYFLTWSSNTVGDRYTLLDNDVSNPPQVESHFQYKVEESFNNFYVKKKNTANISRSNYEMSEGFGLNWKNFEDVNLNPSHALTNQGNATVNVRYTGNLGQHQTAIKVNDVSYDESNYSGFVVQNRSFEIPTSEISNGAIINVNGLVATNDAFSLAFASIEYPRSFDFDNAESFAFTIAESNSTKYFEIENFNTGSSSPILYDITNGQRIVTSVSNGFVRFVLPSSNEKRNLVLINDAAGVKTINSIHNVDFIDYSQEDAEFIIISSQFLFDDGQGNNWVEEYADYRANDSPVQNYSTIVVEIEQLYDQFAYGINRHVLSIRNFGHFVHANWSAPKYGFILGKAREYPAIRGSSQLQANIGTTFFVPTFGWPGADNLLFATNESSVPVIPISRVTATTPDEVRIYLNKVKGFESNQNLSQTLEDKAWMKRVIHLGGGDPSIQDAIKGHLTILENEIESNQYGGLVHNFYKTSSDPIQISQSDEIEDLINTGVSLITFFGHSGAGSFDFSIDSPENYENTDRYPLMISLGCFSGHIHNSSKGISEKFVMTEDRGAIGFFASRGYGYIPALRNFAQKYYELMGGAMYGQGLGDILKSTIQDFDNSSIPGVAELAQQFTLNGDPCLRLNTHPGPDFLIDGSTLSFNPSSINVQMQEYELRFKTMNIGINTEDSVQLEIIQELPNGLEVTLINQKIKSPAYQEELSFTVPVLGEQSIGLNRLYIRIDSEYEVDEKPAPFAEQNNELMNSQFQAGVSFYVVANDVRPISPTPFSIVGNPALKLKASTADVFAEEQKYIFEMDTTELFNSPFKERKELVQIGGIIEWEPNLNMTNNTVYYWRVSPDSTSGAGYVWRNSSFIYLNGSEEGWNQSHYYQYNKDRFVNMELPEESRRFKYLDDVKDITINNGEYPTYYPLFLINNTRMTGLIGNTINTGVYVAVFDSITVDPWENIGSSTDGGYFGSYNSSNNRRIFAFPYKTDNVDERAKLINFLENDIPSNSYVLFWTIQKPNDGYFPEDWALDSLTLGTNLFQVLEAQGANLIRNTEMEGSKPYAFFYKKDNPNYALTQDFLVEADGYIEENFAVEGNWDTGLVESTIIGPASEWTELHWKTSEFEMNNDEQSVNVYAIRTDQSDSLMHEKVIDFDLNLEGIDANEYPYLRLEFNSADTLFRTSPQLDYWRVVYKGIPEAALKPSAHYSLQHDTIQQGQTLEFDLAVENISQYNMDSLLVKYVVTDLSNNEVFELVRNEPLLKEETLITQLSFDTRNLSGLQRLLIEVNPNEDQTELYHWNNIGLTEFFVEGDIMNPILDVTFDGVHIMDGDIVASKPEILISLNDENENLLLTDTTLFNVFLKHPDEEILRRMYFDGEIMTFYPAENSNNEKNEAEIEFNPHLLKDGIYQLFVQAEDASGNQSGDLDYKVNFEVITKAMISNVLNYPNPFSTATRFVYTLTGEEPPAYFKIQIMSVSGRIVKEITNHDLGQMRIGTHMTDYVWDGTDDFGDKLANGVYLYRVVAKKANGEDYESYSTGTDQFFKKGFGKLVILR